MWKKLSASILSAALVVTTFGTVAAPTAAASPLKFTKKCDIEVRDGLLRLRPQNTEVVPAWPSDYRRDHYNDGRYDRDRGKNRYDRDRNRNRPSQRTKYRSGYAIDNDNYRVIDLQIRVKKGPIYVDPRDFDLIVMDRFVLRPIYTGRLNELQAGPYSNGVTKRSRYFPDVVLTQKEERKDEALVLRYRGYGSTCYWTVPARRR